MTDHPDSIALERLTSIIEGRIEGLSLYIDEDERLRRTFLLMEGRLSALRDVLADLRRLREESWNWPTADEFDDFATALEEGDS
jgi:hypothetical protein